MSREKRSVPLYHRYRDSGVRSHSLAGVSAALGAGDDAAADAVTWLVRADTLNGLMPSPGRDHMRDTAGTWWTVTEVGPAADGVYPLKCQRWKDGDE